MTFDEFTLWLESIDKALGDDKEGFQFYRIWIETMLDHYMAKSVVDQIFKVNLSGDFIV